MKRSRFSEEQVIGMLKEHQAGLSAAYSNVAISVKPQNYTHDWFLGRLLTWQDFSEGALENDQIP